jgi:uncharacterized protein YjcR
MKKRKNIRWSLVDLTRPAAEIADELDCDVSLVYRARKRAGIVMPNMSGGKIGNKGGAPMGNQNRKGKTLMDAMTPYQLRLPRKIIELIKDEAKRSNTTASDVIRLALISHLKLDANGTEETQID